MCDTIAVVFLRNGKIAKAKTYSDKAIAMLDESNYAAPQIHLNAAEIMLASGELANARKAVEGVMAHPRCTSYLARQARDLLGAIAKREK